MKCLLWLFECVSLLNLSFSAIRIICESLSSFQFCHQRSLQWPKIMKILITLLKRNLEASPSGLLILNMPLKTGIMGTLIVLAMLIISRLDYLNFCCCSPPIKITCIRITKINCSCQLQYFVLLNKTLFCFCLFYKFT